MKKRLDFKLILLFALLLPAFLHAQDKSIHLSRTRTEDTIVVSKQDTAQQKDIYDVIRSISHKPVLEKTSVITTRPIISIVPAIGYTLQSRFVGTLSGNMAFRMAPKSRISTIIANVTYTQNKQFTLPVQSNIWTKNNEYDFIGDFRFYKYPQSTFGLGSNSPHANEDPMNYSFFRFYEIVLRHIAGNFYVGAGYIFDDHWNVSEKGPLNGSISDYNVYGKASRAISTGITLNALFDSRDNSINPSKGFYTSLQYRDNYRFMGSSFVWRSLIIDIRRYYRLPANSNNVIAIWSYDWLVLSGKPSYLDLPATTYDPYNGTGRGYIQGRFRGAQMVYLETEYRFRITVNGLIGGVFFVNAQSLSAAPGTGLQIIQPGFGPGLRIKLNKVSKTNIGIDYGFGREGSRGLFVSVGELF